MFSSVIIYFLLILYTMLSCKYVCNIELTLGRLKSSFIIKFVAYLVIFCPMIVIYGLRYNVGVDYETYHSYFKYFKTIIASWNDIWGQHFEAGYVLLNKIGFVFFHKDYGVFLVSGILISALIFKLLLQHKDMLDTSLLVFVYFAVYFGASCNIVRQVIAMLIIANGYNLLLKKNYKSYFFVCCIAFLFHKSAAVCTLLILVDIVHERIGKKIKGYIIICSVILTVAGQIILNFISSSSLFKITYERSGINYDAFLFLLYLVPEVYFIEKTKKYIDTFPRSEVEMLICIFYLQIPFQLLDIFSSALQRVGIYFSIVQIILIPAIVKSIKKIKNCYWIKAMVIFWYILFFALTEIVLVGNGLFPYNFYYNTIK